MRCILVQGGYKQISLKLSKGVNLWRAAGIQKPWNRLWSSYVSVLPAENPVESSMGLDKNTIISADWSPSETVTLPPSDNVARSQRCKGKKERKWEIVQNKVLMLCHDIGWWTHPLIDGAFDQENLIKRAPNRPWCRTTPSQRSRASKGIKLTQH